MSRNPSIGPKGVAISGTDHSIPAKKPVRAPVNSEPSATVPPWPTLRWRCVKRSPSRPSGLGSVSVVPSRPQPMPALTSKPQKRLDATMYSPW